MYDVVASKLNMHICTVPLLPYKPTCTYVLLPYVGIYIRYVVYVMPARLLFEESLSSLF